MRKSTPKLSLQDSTVEAFKPALRDAIESGDVQKFKQLLAHPVPSQLKKLLLEDDFLVLAVEAGSLEIVRELLDGAKASGMGKVLLQKSIVRPGSAKSLSSIVIALLGVAAFENQSAKGKEVIHKLGAYRAIARCLLEHDDDQQQQKAVRSFVKDRGPHTEYYTNVTLSGSSVWVGDQEFSAVHTALTQTTLADLVQAITAACSDPGQMGSSRNIAPAGSQEMSGLYQQPGNLARRPF